MEEVGRDEAAQLENCRAQGCGGQRFLFDLPTASITLIPHLPNRVIVTKTTRHFRSSLNATKSMSRSIRSRSCRRQAKRNSILSWRTSGSELPNLKHQGGFEIDVNILYSCVGLRAWDRGRDYMLYNVVRFFFFFFLFFSHVRRNKGNSIMNETDTDTDTVLR